MSLYPMILYEITFLTLLALIHLKFTDAGQEGDVVDPWNVASGSDKGIDYEKLIKKFGSSELDDALIRRFEQVTGKPPHHLLKRGVFFSHRDLDTILTL